MPRAYLLFFLLFFLDWSSTTAVACAPGFYTAGSSCVICAQGRYGSSSSLTNSACSGACAAGRYGSSFYEFKSSSSWTATGTSGPLGKLMLESATLTSPVSIMMGAMWKDQSWGNNQGCIRAEVSRGGAIVAARNLLYPAPQTTNTFGAWETASLDAATLGATAGDTIQIWAYVRGCGSKGTGSYFGHELYVTEIHAMIYAASTTSDCTGICPAGTFSAGDAGSCTACNDHEYAEEGSSRCENCPAGRYGTTPSATSACSGNCQAGKSSSAGSSSCTNCSPGRYSDAAESSACADCDSGRWGSGGDTSSSCTGPCLAGRYGTYAEVAETCSGPCPSGSWSTAGSGSCSICPRGRYGTGASQTSACSGLCDLGRFAMTLTGETQSQCAGTCASGSVSTGDRTGCQNCEAGKYALPQSSPGSSCLSCDVGKWSGPKSTSCLLCPRGRYADNLASSHCKECQEGSTTPTNGGASVCEACPAGKKYYKASECTACTEATPVCSACETSCIPCAYGRFASSNASLVCSACVPGRYADALGMTNCTACEEGKYSTLRAFQGPCTEDCSSGRYSDVEALSSVEQCKQCPSNTFSTVSGASDISTCMACTPPATSPPGSSSCSSCSAGTYSPAGGACLTCAKGHICVSGGIVKCAAGTFNDNEGSSLASDCKPCPAGTYSSYEGLTSELSCLPCATGTASAERGRKLPCDACHSGYFADVGRLTSCKNCSAGKTSPPISPAATCALCPAGRALQSQRASECLRCSPGRFSDGAEKVDDNTGLSVGTICKDCTAGTFAEAAGQTSCSNCGMGKYSTAVGASLEQQCVSCPRGTYSSALGISSVDLCVKCSAGKASNVSGATVYAMCKDCVPGTYADVEGSTVCFSCLHGKYAATSKSSSCSLCGLGKFAPSAGLSACSPCPAGRTGEVQGASSLDSCVKCALGRFQLNGSNTCASCPPGKHGKETPVPTSQDNSCTSCMIGTYSPAYGIPSARDCIPCPAGKVGAVIGLRSETGCEVAKPGFFSEGGSRAVRPCAVGRYQDLPGQFFCKLCPSGTFGSGNGSIFEAEACAPCPAGRFSAAEGVQVSSQCTECPVGKYSDIAGASKAEVCQDCLPGTYNNVTGSIECKKCGLGTKSLRGAAACVLCKIGKYGDSAGLSSCLPCPKGRVGSSEGTTSAEGCTQCAGGRYQSGEGSTFCELCPEGKYGEGNAFTHTSNCTSCPKGRYSPSTGLRELTQCIECPYGRFGIREGTTDKEQCSICPRGRHRGIESNLTECEACNPGRFADVTGMKECSSVPNGHYSLEGWSTYRRCPNTIVEEQHETGAEALQRKAVECKNQEFTPRKGFFCMVGCSAMNQSTTFFKCYNPEAWSKRSLVPNITWNRTLSKFKYLPNCKLGYEGPLCAKCRPGYGAHTLSGASSRAQSCYKCLNFGLNTMLVIFFGCILVALVAFIVYRKTRKNRASLTRLVLTFIQFETYASFLATQWPVAVRLMYQVEDTVTTASPEWISLDCFLNRIFGEESRGMLYQAYLVTLWGPGMVFAGIAIFFLATHAYYHSTEPFKPENMRRSVLNFIRTAIIVEWLMWSTILRWILFLFKCNTYGNINLPGDGSGNRGGYDQDSKQYLLEMDLTVSCATTGLFQFVSPVYGRALAFTAVPAIVIHLILFPGFISFMLWNYGRQVKTGVLATAKQEEFYTTYGFLVAGYRHGCEYWELTVLFRRFCVLFCVVFLHDQRQVQVATVFLILLVFFYAHLILKPYALDPTCYDQRTIERGQRADRLERLSLAILLLTMLSAFYFMGELDEKSFVREVLGFVVVALHASFYVVFVYEYISDKTTVEEEDGQQVRRWRRRSTVIEREAPIVFNNTSMRQVSIRRFGALQGVASERVEEKESEKAVSSSYLREATKEVEMEALSYRKMRGHRTSNSSPAMLQDLRINKRNPEGKDEGLNISVLQRKLERRFSSEEADTKSSAIWTTSTPMSVFVEESKTGAVDGILVAENGNNGERTGHTAGIVDPARVADATLDKTTNETEGQEGDSTENISGHRRGSSLVERLIPSEQDQSPGPVAESVKSAANAEIITAGATTSVAVAVAATATATSTVSARVIATTEAMAETTTTAPTMIAAAATTGTTATTAPVMAILESKPSLSSSTKVSTTNPAANVNDVHISLNPKRTNRDSVRAAVQAQRRILEAEREEEV